MQDIEKILCPDCGDNLLIHDNNYCLWEWTHRTISEYQRRVPKLDNSMSKAWAIVDFIATKRDHPAQEKFLLATRHLVSRKVWGGFYLDGFLVSDKYCMLFTDPEIVYKSFLFSTKKEHI